MYRVFLSVRFLRYHWLMTLIGSFFVGASLVILVVVMAVMDGFQHRLRETVAGSSADLILTPTYPADLDALADALDRDVPQVVASGPYYETIAVTRRTGRIDPLEQKMHFAVVQGVDGRKEQQVNRFGEYLRTRTTPERLTVQDLSRPFHVHDDYERATGTIGVIVGEGLRREMNVGLGQKIRLFTVTSDATGAMNGAQGAPQAFELRAEAVLVVGVYESGNSEIDAHVVFMEDEDFTRFFPNDVYRPSLRSRLGDPEEFDAAVGRLHRHKEQILRASVAPGVQPHEVQLALRPESWKDKNRQLVQAIESEKSMILVIAFLIVIAGTSSIFAAQWLLVSDKVREIGILRALGAGVAGIMTIFVMNGFLMGFLGSIGGALLGLLVVARIDTVHGWISYLTGRDPFDPNIYLFKQIPTRVDYGDVTTYAAAALVCTLVASAIPAMRAGLMDPAKALHRD